MLWHSPRITMLPMFGANPFIASELISPRLVLALHLDGRKSFHEFSCSKWTYITAWECMGRSTKFILRGLEILADDKLALRNVLGTKWLVRSFDELSKKLNFSNVAESFFQRFSPWHGLARNAFETLANQLLHLHTKVFLFNPLCCWMHSLMSNNALALPVHIFQTFAPDAVKGFFSRKAFSSL